MKALGFDGILFSAVNVYGGIEPFAAGPSRRPITVPRNSASPLHSGVSQDARMFTATFGPKAGYTGETALIALLGLLNMEDASEREFLAQLNDGTNVTCQMSVGPYRWTNTKELQVDFYATDPRWRALADTTYSFTATAAAPSGVTVAPLVNGGGVQVSPTITIQPTVQRSGSTASCGWTYYQTVTVTNNSNEDWTDELITIVVNDSAALVTAAKAQADGDDLRVRYQGKEYYRTLACWNTKFSLVHVLVSIKKGKSKTLELWYGNPSATAPKDLSTRTGTDKTYAAPDLEGDSGTATAASTTSKIVLAGKSYETNRWRYGFVGIVGGTGATRWRRIKSSDANSLTLDRPLATAPDGTSSIVLFRTGPWMDGGRVTGAGGVGTSTFADNLQNLWGTNQLEGATITFVGGSAANPSTVTVASNDSAGGITITGTWTTPPSVGDSFTVQRYGHWAYNVDGSIYNALHNGLYRANRLYEPPGNIWPGKLTPAGWGPDIYLNNKDDFAAYRPYNLGSGGGHTANWRAYPRMRRRVAQAGTLQYEGEGDGFSFYTPQTLQGFRYDCLFKNEGKVGQFLIVGREPGSADWRILYSDNTKHSDFYALAPSYLDLNAYNNPNRLGVFVAPYDGTLIPVTATDGGSVTGSSGRVITDSAQSWYTDQWKGATLAFDAGGSADPSSFTVVSSTATTLTVDADFTTAPTTGDTYSLSLDTNPAFDVEFKPNTTWELDLSLDTHSALSGSLYTASGETAIYDFQPTLRLGGSTNATPDYEQVTFGGDGHWLGVPLNYKVQLTMDPDSSTPVARILDSGGTFVSRCPWAAVINHVTTDIDGNALSEVPPTLFPLRPAINLLSNPSFASNLTGWSSGGTTGGVTVAVTNNQNVLDPYLQPDLNSSDIGTMKFAVTGAPAGAWHTYQTTHVSAIPVNALAEGGIWFRTSNVNLHGHIDLTLTGGGTVQTASYVFTAPAINTWYPIGLGAFMPVGDYTSNSGTADLTIGIDATGAVTGTVYFDFGSLGPPNMYVSESNMGTLVCTAAWRRAWNS